MQLGRIGIGGLQQKGVARQLPTTQTNAQPTPTAPPAVAQPTRWRNCANRRSHVAAALPKRPQTSTPTTTKRQRRARTSSGYVWRISKPLSENHDVLVIIGSAGVFWFWGSQTLMFFCLLAPARTLSFFLFCFCLRPCTNHWQNQCF